MARGATLTRSEFVAEVARLVSARATGTLFVRTADAHTARVVIKEGEIVGVAYRGTRGVAAIPFLQGLGDSSIEFTEGFVFPISETEKLPSTSTLLGMLRRVSGPHASELARDDALSASLGALLAEFIGPFASHVMREIAHANAETRIDWSAAVDRMATEVDAGQVEEFIKRARTLLA